MAHSNASSQDWFYHSVEKQKKTANAAEQPSTSQIPGLSSGIPECDTQDDQSKRQWIRETDSKYVKLAKAGGRKDIFQYKEHKPPENGPQAYPRVDWFDHAYSDKEEEGDKKPVQSNSFQSTLPDWYTPSHDAEDKGQSTSERERPLLAFDDLSIWTREENQQNKGHVGKSKKNAPPAVIAPVIRRQPEKEDLHHLLSMGYQRDWLDQRDKQARQDKRDRISKQNVKVTSQAALSPKKNAKEAQEERPLFKLSKFTNVPPKINTFRT